MSLIPTYWHWLFLACLFLVLELVIPSAFFLWLTLAAITSALVAFIAADLGWQLQYVLFAIFCVLSLVAWRRFASDGDVIETDQPHLNHRSGGYVGRTLVLSEAIVNGVGKVKVDDSQWKVTGEDAEVGTRVKIISADGSILQVESA